MCNPLAAVTAVLGVAGLGMSAYQGSKQRKAARQAQTANEQSAERDRQRAEEQYNKANQRMPDVAAMLANNQSAARRGIGSTFLTGPGGAAVDKLALGTPSLLGA